MSRDYIESYKEKKKKKKEMRHQHAKYERIGRGRLSVERNRTAALLMYGKLIEREMAYEIYEILFLHCHSRQALHTHTR